MIILIMLHLLCMQVSGVFDLPDVVSWWLCCSAYRRVLEKHEPARMKVLIKLLSSKMTAAANTMVNHRCTIISYIMSRYNMYA